MNKKDIFLISIGIFLTVIFWLIADLYHASTQERIKDSISAPVIVNHDINKQVLKIIEEKQE
jgi:hypothetical protein